MFKIESNVPVPEAVRSHGTRYPWAEMRPGDSFAVESKRAASAAYNAARMRGIQVRKGVDAAGQWRVWLR